MANWDRNFTDQLRERLSILDVVSRRVPLTKKGQNYWGCCPFHNEKTPSFSVNEEKGFYHCFGCGEHGDIISFVMKSENVDFKTAISNLAELAGIKLPEYKPKSAQQIDAEESYLNIVRQATQIYQENLFTPSGATALEYIRKRGFSDEMIKKYKLGYAPKNNIISGRFADIPHNKLLATGLVRVGNYGPYDFFRDKLMFPIFNVHGDIIAFSGRSLDGSEPKYINTSETELFHKGHTVFGLNFARDAIHRANHSIVVEGQIDAIQMQCNGFGETVAPLGTALTEYHIGLLCKSNRNITFCFDGDGAGQKAAVRACGLVMPFLHDNSDVRFAFVSGGKDPDEVLKTSGPKAMQEIIDNAIPLVDFLWKIANTNYLVSTPGGRSQSEKFIKSELEKITDQDLKNEYTQEFNSRKFDSWHKWKKSSKTPVITVPKIDSVTENTLIFITNKYPEIVETYGEFLSTLGLDFEKHCDFELNFNLQDAEKYVISLKLQKYMEKLQNQKKEITAKILSGEITDKTQLSELDSEIEKVNSKLDTLIFL